jgi:MraZ protein
MGVVKRKVSVFHPWISLRTSMLLGQHHLNLESDRRLVIPEPFRELFKTGAYVTRGFELDLLIMSDTVFQKIYQRVVELNIADPLARILLRLILGNASRLEISDSGHALIPDNLLSFAGLEKEIILVGQGDYAELWSPAHWENQTAILYDAEANADRFSHLDLALHKNLASDR